MKANTDWKDYKSDPEVDLFDSIQRRLRLRRAWRITGGVAAVALVATLAGVLISPNRQEEPAATQKSATVSVSQLQPALPSVEVEKSQVEEQELQPVSHSAVKVAPKTIEVQKKAEVSEVAAVAPQVVTVQKEDVQKIEPIVASPEVAPETQEIAEVVDSTPIEPAIEVKAGTPPPTPYHEDNLLWAPNIIAPNGEREENRCFIVKVSSAISEFKLHIYNRGGRLLFNTEDVNFQWDATHKGTPVPQGAYVWVATFRDSDGEPQRTGGTVTVIR